MTEKVRKIQDISIKTYVYVATNVVKKTTTWGLRVPVFGFAPHLLKKGHKISLLFGI